jgi:tetratricopeptide (TPR) repeat protein
MAGFGCVCLVAIAAAAATAFFLTRGDRLNQANTEQANPAQTQVGELAALTNADNPSSTYVSPLTPESQVSPAEQPLQSMSERYSTPGVRNELSQVVEFSADDLILQARQMLADQQPKQAVELLQQAVKLNPRHFAGQMNLGHAMWQMKNYQGAIQSYGRATQLEPQNGFAVFCLASSSALAGQLDNSIAQFERAIEVNPALPEAYNGLGEVLYARFLANTWRGNDSREDLTRAVYCFFRARGIAPHERRYSDNMSWVNGILTDTERQDVGRDLILNRLPWAEN